MSLETPVATPDPQFKLGCRLPTVRRFAAVPAFREKCERIDPKDWEEVSLLDWRTQRYQQQHSDCTGNGTATGAGLLWHMLTGQPLKFCAAWIYAQVNGGRDEGAMVRDAVMATMKTGCATQDVAGEHKIYANQYGPDAKADAGKHFVAEAHQCEDWIDCGSALMRRKPVVFGILLGQRFFGTGPDGIVPPWDGQVANGHCMCLTGIKKVNGVWRFELSQSWPQWGTPQQTGYIDESYFAPTVHTRQWGDVPNLDAYALDTIRNQTGDSAPVLK